MKVNPNPITIVLVVRIIDSILIFMVLLLVNVSLLSAFIGQTKCICRTKFHESDT